MKYYIVAGEASGDLHGYGLIQSIKKYDSDSEIRAWGGELINGLGVKLDKHINELAFMGFVEVLANIRTIKANFSHCKKNILDFNPDVLILIDYPGFNLRMAKWAKKQNIRVFYFISPTIWAWHTSRVYTVKDCVERMYTILPFEKEFYKKFDVDVEYYGNPLLNKINNFERPNQIVFREENKLGDKDIIALLAGSRNQEIKNILPVMCEIVKEFPEYEFVLAGTSTVDRKLYENIIEGTDIRILYGKTYEILSVSRAAIVTSGTATLETALFGVPQVVCYKGNKLSVAIARLVAKVKYISLVNLILDKALLKELIQKDCNSKALASELQNILPGGDKHTEILKGYEKLHEILGNYDTYESIAKDMYERLLSDI